MLDRSQLPALSPIEEIDFIQPKVYPISPTVNLYLMDAVPNETARVDLYFDAGTVKADVGIASFTNGLLLSGTHEKTSVQIQEVLNGLGGFYESHVSTEQAIVTIHCLREYLLQCLHVFKYSIENIAFHQHEVEELINDRRQKFKTSMEKVSFVAQRAFQQELFHDSLYGRVTNETDFDSISDRDIKRFFRDSYLNGLTKVVVVGNFSEEDINEIIDKVKNWTADFTFPYQKDLANKPGIKHIEKTNAVQSALRVGRMLFNKKHEDYPDFLVLNTILGDYFGSRLMSNIREDKGYTYGIGSMLAELHEVGYFMIATEVGSEVKDATLHEIQHEFTRLQTELVEEGELALVQNYMLGQLLKNADGPYSMIDLFLSIEPYDLTLDFYNTCIHRINTITPQRIQQLAQRYLNWEDFTVVSAG